MKICHAAIPVLAWSQDDTETLLSLKLKVQSTLESGVDQLLQSVGSRNVTQIAALVQNLVEDTVSAPGASELGEEVAQALHMIKGALLGDIRGALKEAHCHDQVELHEVLFCFDQCERTKIEGLSSCPSYCDGSAHRTCRASLLELYKSHVNECQRLDTFVRDFTTNNCPRFTPQCCMLPHTTWNCGGCNREEHELQVNNEIGTWLQNVAARFSSAEAQWRTLHQRCADSYTAYVVKDAECDCAQAECETNNCEYESCHYVTCEDVYNRCWGRCEIDYEATNRDKECLEKDRKIDWSATEKIECFVNVLLEKPTAAQLNATCGTEDCFNEYRQAMYHKCHDICVEVDFGNSSTPFQEHTRRDFQEGDHAESRHEGAGWTVKDQATHRGHDIDVTGEGQTHTVRTRHRGAGEDRCTSHLDLDYQLPPCCHPCEERPVPPCKVPVSGLSYEHIHYEDLDSPDPVPGVSGRACHGEHTLAFAYNRCDCIDCPDMDPVPDPTCTEQKACDEGERYDYGQHALHYDRSDGSYVSADCAALVHGASGHDVDE